MSVCEDNKIPISNDGIAWLGPIVWSLVPVPAGVDLRSTDLIQWGRPDSEEIIKQAYPTTLGALQPWTRPGLIWSCKQRGHSQKCRAGNSLICSSLIRSFWQIKWATVSELLRLLRGNERPWANCSGRSRQMSDPKRFAQVAHRKWANERLAQKFLLKKSKILFLVCFLYDFKFFL